MSTTKLGANLPQPLSWAWPCPWAAPTNGNGIPERPGQGQPKGHLTEQEARARPSPRGAEFKEDFESA